MVQQNGGSIGMDGIDIALRFIGAFYAFAGFAACRGALMSDLLDKALAALTLQKTPVVERRRAIWLLTLSLLIFAGGICLMLLLEPAAWLFAFSAIIQALYFLVLGPYYFDKAEPPDPQGRRRSINAFVIYSASTCFALWAAYRGRLIPLANIAPWQFAAAGGLIALQLGYVLRHTHFPPKRKSGFASFDDDASTDDISADDSGLDYSGLPASSKRIKVMADYSTYPLWAMDEGLMGDFAPQELGVSDELSADLWTWANDFDASLNPDDPANSRWSDERHMEHIERGIALARRIKYELPDREVFVHNTTGDLIEIVTHADGTTG
jgi:hypothetical protein